MEIVVDPLDGSTNAALGLPWCATALCLVVAGVGSSEPIADNATPYGRELNRRIEFELR